MHNSAGGKVRTALINPPDVLRVGYGEDDATPPLGIAYIAAVLREQGYPADLYDLAHFDLNAAAALINVQLEKIGFFSYSVYGFTAYTKSFPAALRVISLLRQRNPTAVIVLGGPHASPSAEEVLADYDGIDCVICNEGEYPMLELVRHLSRGTPALRDVPNLVYRVDELENRRAGRPAPTGTAICRSPRTHWVKELDSLPRPVRDYVVEPARTSLRYDRRDRPVQEAFVSSSRGCPKRCTFCSIVVASPNYRVRSVES